MSLEIRGSSGGGSQSNAVLGKKLLNGREISEFLRDNLFDIDKHVVARFELGNQGGEVERVQHALGEKIGRSSKVLSLTNLVKNCDQIFHKVPIALRRRKALLFQSDGGRYGNPFGIDGCVIATQILPCEELPRRRIARAFKRRSHDPDRAFGQRLRENISKQRLFHFLSHHAAAHHEVHDLRILTLARNSG